MKTIATILISLITNLAASQAISAYLNNNIDGIYFAESYELYKYIDDDYLDKIINDPVSFHSIHLPFAVSRMGYFIFKNDIINNYAGIDDYFKSIKLYNIVNVCTFNYLDEEIIHINPITLEYTMLKPIDYVILFWYQK